MKLKGIFFLFCLNSGKGLGSAIDVLGPAEGMFHVLPPRYTERGSEWLGNVPRSHAACRLIGCRPSSL